MAKKDPMDMPVEERLKTLFQLQTTLSGIDEKRALRGELPLEVQDLEDEIEGLTTRMDKINADIAEFEQAVTLKKGEIETAKASVERYKAQLNDVKNNREYDTLSKEIEYQTLEIELCNKKIKEAAARIEEKKQELAQNQEIIDDRRQDLDIKKGELDEIMEERIRKNARNGLGIVYVQRDACGGCFNKIPPQRQLDIKMHKKVIVCEYCGRILIDPELAGVKIDKITGQEEKKTRKRSIRRTVKKADPEIDAPEVPEAED